MKKADLIRLIFLSAIWGSSFIFMRIVAPVMGPFATAGSRLFLAGLMLHIYFFFTNYKPEWKKNFKHYLVMGVVNSAIPFTLFAFAASHIPAAYSVILNATSPLFGAIFSFLFLKELLSFKKMFGLLLGIAGVTLIVLKKGQQVDLAPLAFVSMLACLLAAACYALAAIYMKKFGQNIKPVAMAGASPLLAGLILFPLAIMYPPEGEITVKIIGALLALAILCSAIAYLLYYKLLANVGVTKALLVTYLMPFFGILWAILFLGEELSIPILVGGGIIILSTYIGTKK
ncbi:MAG: EamA family transporter [Bacteriovoracaceae bacterium]|nr:EamA family transporter [Bacteriovoracaceae bacterium]